MKLVIDSNVFAKLYIDEPDSNKARKFLKSCVEKDVELLAPMLFEYELLQIALYYDYPIESVLQSIEMYKNYNLSLIHPNADTWLQAEKIVKQDHVNSGFPTLYDSIYHALAIHENCNFITADKRHKAKTEQFGHIILLQDWVFKNA